MKNLLMVFACLLFPQLAFAGQVTFAVTPLSMPDGAVYITGSHLLIGNWKPDEVALIRQSDGTWRKTIEFSEGTTLEYKFTRGSWDREALDSDNTIRRNSQLIVAGDTTVVVEVPKWKDEAPDARRKIQGQITGTVIYHNNMTAEGVLPRDVLVWLPPSYENDKTKRYPVLYMHDAQQIFDPATSTHGIDWQIDETVTRLIAEKKMQEIIVVGNTCTANRFEEYSDGKAGKAYQHFMVNVLKPFIDANYRTLPGREHTSVMGSSMGGIASFLLVWHHPEAFSMAGCFSPAFWLDWQALKTSDWPKPGLPVTIYMDNGGIGLEQRLQPGCDLMLTVLPQKGFRLGDNVIWYQDAKAEHSEEAWAKRAWMPLLYKYGIGSQQDWLKNLPAVPKPFFAERDKEPRDIITSETLYVLGMIEQFTDDDQYIKFEELWNKFLPRCSDLYVDTPVYVGVRYTPDDDRIEYIAGGLVARQNHPVPDGMVMREIPAAKYLRYSHPGPIATIRESYNYLLDWYLPHHDYLRANLPVIERWIHTDPARASVELYIPID